MGSTDKRLTLTEAKKIAYDIAKDLLYYGYNFNYFMSYNLTKSIGRKKCKIIWKNAIEEMCK